MDIQCAIFFHWGSFQRKSVDKSTWFSVGSIHGCLRCHCDIQNSPQRSRSDHNILIRMQGVPRFSCNPGILQQTRHKHQSSAQDCLPIERAHTHTHANKKECTVDRQTPNKKLLQQIFGISFLTLTNFNHLVIAEFSSGRSPKTICQVPIQHPLPWPWFS